MNLGVAATIAAILIIAAIAIGYTLSARLNPAGLPLRRYQGRHALGAHGSVTEPLEPLPGTPVTVLVSAAVSPDAESIFRELNAMLETLDPQALR